MILRLNDIKGRYFSQLKIPALKEPPEAVIHSGKAFLFQGRVRGASEFYIYKERQTLNLG